MKDDPDFFKKVFCINDKEFRWYPKGEELKSVNEVPQYHRATPAIPATLASGSKPFAPTVSGSHPLTPSVTPRPASGSFTPTPTPIIQSGATPANPATPAQPATSTSTPTPTPTTLTSPTPTPSTTASASFSPTPKPTSSITPTPTSTDTTPPILSSVLAFPNKGLPGEVNVYFTSNEETSGQVEYGLTTSYGRIGQFFPNFRSLDHSYSIQLNGDQGVAYHYRVTAKDAAGNTTVSGDNTFTTTTCAPINVSISSRSPSPQNVSFGQSGVPLAIFELKTSCYVDLKSFAVSLLPMPNGYQNISSLRLFWLDNSNYANAHQIGSAISVSNAALNFPMLQQGTPSDAINMYPNYILPLEVTGDIGPSAVNGSTVYAVFGGSSAVISRSTAPDAYSVPIGNNASGNIISGNTMTIVAPTPTPTHTASVSFNFSRDLYLGSKGGDVKQLQAILVNEVSYSANLVTGYFGRLTQEAVKNLQEKYGITPALGYFGEITRRALSALISNR